MDLHFIARLLIVAIALTWVLAPMLQHWMKARPSAAGTVRFWPSLAGFHFSGGRFWNIAALQQKSHYLMS